MMRIHPSVNVVNSYVIQYVRNDDGDPVETRLSSTAIFAVSKKNQHWLLELKFDDMCLIYDMEDKILIQPEENNFYMESFSILKVANRQFVLTGTFLLISENNEIAKEYRFVGENDMLPPGVSYFDVPEK